MRATAEATVAAVPTTLQTNSWAEAAATVGSHPRVVRNRGLDLVALALAAGVAGAAETAAAASRAPPAAGSTWPGSSFLRGSSEVLGRGGGGGGGSCSRLRRKPGLRRKTRPWRCWVPLPLPRPPQVQAPHENGEAACAAKKTTTKMTMVALVAPERWAPSCPWWRRCRWRQKPPGPSQSSTLRKRMRSEDRRGPRCQSCLLLPLLHYPCPLAAAVAQPEL
mmetsp:Transcript_45593/g.77447  ORF Transcript_45593/g.77447 Transcript_45593/m.77447 type:complete len:221 (-) Transcript_45593:70-732(-)